MYGIHFYVQQFFGYYLYLKAFFANQNIGEPSQKEIDVLMKTLDVNRNGQINLVEYAARAKEFVKKRILLTFLLQFKARGNNLYQKI